MKLSEIYQRCNNGEVVVLENIEDQFPDEYIKKYPKQFTGLTVQDEFEHHGVIWIFNQEIRNKGEYNPCLSKRES